MVLQLSLDDAVALPPGQLKHWAYCALDTTGTREVWDVLNPRLDEKTSVTYKFEKALQAPALAMARRGVRVDIVTRNKVTKELERELDNDYATVGRLPQIVEVWDLTELETGICPGGVAGKNVKPPHHKWPRGVPDTADRRCTVCGTPRVKLKDFNPGSPDQCQHLFYDLLKCEKMKNKAHKVSTDDDCLDRIGRKYPKCLPIVEAILAVRDKVKQLGTLNSKLSPSNRWHSTFNVGAAWTGRFSSSKDAFQRGGNLQNISERHRVIFVADAGFELSYADLKQAESLGVAHLANDPAYVEAHLSGDTHTFVARLVWPDLAWTGDIKKDKKLAKETLPTWDHVEGHDLRFQSKRIQHGSNYGLSPQGIAMIAHIPVSVAATAQGNYFSAFPHIRQWQEGQREKVKAVQPLENPLGRRAQLFGRPWDPHTYKQGLAFEPQSLVADALDAAMFLVWEECDPALIQLLAQVHDAILSQWERGKREECVGRLVDLMTIPIPILGRTMKIPVEIAVGQNWGKKSKDNPNGMEEIEI